jgi:hypothetical protein
MSWGRLNWELIRPYGRYLYYALSPNRRPGYFRDAWKYPSYRLNGSPLSTPRVPGTDKPTCFFFPMTDWHTRIQRPQQLAKAFAEMGYRCVYVNPHLGLEYRKPYLFDPYPHVSILPSGILELHIHLPREHELNQRFLSSGEVSRVLSAVEALIRAEQIGAGIVITSVPVWLDAVRSLRRSHAFPILYDCHDLLEGFDRLPRAVAAAEGELFQASDFVAFTSQNLMDLMIGRMPSLRGKAALVRNAADPRDFATRANSAMTSASPIIGYMGALDHWFDTEAVAEAARAHPRWTFELVGRVEDPRIRRLREFRNVRFVDEVPYAQVPEYLASWNAAMIPFLRNPLTLATNPIKMYEYYNAGLPVVSTRLPEVELFGNLAYLADTPRQFAELVAKAVEEDPPALALQRKETARSETWHCRANALLALAGVPYPAAVGANSL